MCNVALVRTLTAAVQAAGARALAPMVDPDFKVVDMRSNWSERHAAFTAGLGTFSRNRSLITRLGAAGRFGSVITDAELEPTPRPYLGVSQADRKVLLMKIRAYLQEAAGKAPS